MGPPERRAQDRLDQFLVNRSRRSQSAKRVYGGPDCVAERRRKQNKAIDSEVASEGKTDTSARQ